jgi:hypothetical protein
LEKRIYLRNDKNVSTLFGHTAATQIIMRLMETLGGMLA